MNGHTPAGSGDAHRPGPSGAALRDELARHERRRRRAELPTIIGLLLFGVLIAVAGRDELGVVVAGVWILGLGVLFLAARAARSAEQHARPRLSPTLVVDRAEPSTVIPAGARPDQLAAAIPGWTAVALAAVSAVLLADSSSAGLVTGAGAAGFAALSLRMVLRARRPGIRMTPATLAVRDARGSLSVAWADIVDVIAPATATGPVMLRLATTRHGSATSTASVVSLAPIRTDRLPGGGVGIARVVQHYRDPVSAGELGSDASLTTITRLLDHG
jgi:hypothetical protein